MKKKYLVETSAVLPAIGFSNRDHNEYFRQTFGEGELYASIYIRMEVIRKWVCELIEFAELLDQCSTVSDAFLFWSQTYGRKPKVASDVVGWILRQRGIIGDLGSHQVAIEVAQKAVEILQAFDLCLPSKINNTCGCRRGGLPLAVDYRALLRELSRFRKDFLAGAMDCRIAVFLQLTNPKGRAGKLLNCPVVASDIKIASPLQDIVNAQRVACTQCKRIGDQVIALEQPAGVTLVHVDASYDILCACTGRDHVKIRSALSFKPTAS
ncbi:MAG: hypothetical protein NTU53_12575 [Planctomycetota bacterium]|nr:hypothetical protein [Planctomycetota bacterium]